jgi:hypothetical protein
VLLNACLRANRRKKDDLSERLHVITDGLVLTMQEPCVLQGCYSGVTGVRKVITYGISRGHKDRAVVAVSIRGKIKELTCKNKIEW